MNEQRQLGQNEDDRVETNVVFHVNRCFPRACVLGVAVIFIMCFCECWDGSDVSHNVDVS